MPSRVLVVGNLGYNGPLVVGALKGAGHCVVGYDTEFFSAELYRDPALAPDRQIRKDVRDIVAEDLDEVDAVVHLAALSNDALGEIDPSLTHGINHHAVTRTAGLAKAAGVRHFVFASSCSVYGVRHSGEIATEDHPLDPRTSYAEAKVNAELDLRALADDGFHVTILRCATMHGPSPRPRLDVVVNNLVANALIVGKAEVLSDGTPWRPLLSVADFADIVARVLENPPEDTIFNTGFDAENFTVRTIGEAVSEILGVPLCVNSEATPDERSYRVSFERLAAAYPDLRCTMPMRRSIPAISESLKSNRFAADDLKNGTYVRLRSLKRLRESGRLDHELRWFDRSTSAST